jgi:hypothetical protein
MLNNGLHFGIVSEVVDSSLQLLIQYGRVVFVQEYVSR